MSPTPPVASFDWQGRLAGNISFGLTNLAGSTNVHLTVSGDSTINAGTASAVAALPTITATPYATPAATPTPTATATPVPPAGVGGCSIGLFPEAMTIRKNGNTAALLELSGSIYGNPGQATITFDSTQLRLTYGTTSTQATSPQTFTIGPATPVRFDIRDIKNTTSGYTTTVTVVSDCGEYATAVTVTN
jgi:hypothetical protein